MPATGSRPLHPGSATAKQKFLATFPTECGIRGSPTQLREGRYRWSALQESTRELTKR